MTSRRTTAHASRLSRIRSAALACALVATAPGAALAQGAPSAAPGAGAPAARAAYDSAWVAWDEGRYTAALEAMQRILAGPDGEAWLEPIALLTGELYVTAEIAPDGRQARWSPDGRYAAYETVEGAETVSHVVSLGRSVGRPVADVRGRGLVFWPAGDVASYLALDETDEMRAARAEAQRLIDAGDFPAARSRLIEVAILAQGSSQLVVRDLRSGRERTVPLRPPRGEMWAGRLLLQSLFYGRTRPDLHLVAAPEAQPDSAHIYRVGERGELARLTSRAGPKQNPSELAGGWLLYGAGSAGFALHHPASGETIEVNGIQPSVSGDGTAVAYVGRDGNDNLIAVFRPAAGGRPTVVKRTSQPLGSPAFSADGSRVAFPMMTREDWELYLVGADGTGEVRLTREIQHDLFPAFLSADRLLAVIGEGRHRRSYLYDLTAFAGGPDPVALANAPGAVPTHRRRFFHNNTVRTVAPEYEWVPSPDGTKVLIVSERDGNTISPERGLYLVDLTRKVSRDQLALRLRDMLAGERRLRAQGERAFAPIAAAVREAMADVSRSRIYKHAHDLFQLDSKYMTEPGNEKAIRYLETTLRSFGYEPELQWFEPEPGVRTANVIARLSGTLHPELIYVVSSHFDSVEEGPGSDDNTSGTTALLETARILASRPQSATIHFAFFTAEEAGLFGSREYVRRAVAAGDRIVGALNNDMIGYMNDNRLDNTIRYSNDGIRDIQHAAAFLFTDLITYDARYYKSTDAHAYYEAYGDIVGGIGSYPILGNPHYHHSHDVLETVSQRLVAEVSKTTAATLMLLASSPSRLTGLEVAAAPGGGAEVQWTTAPESDVTGYVVAWGPPEDPLRETLRVAEPRATVRAAPGSLVSVKAVNSRGLEGWDWAKAEVAEVP